MRTLDYRAQKFYLLGGLDLILPLLGVSLLGVLQKSHLLHWPVAINIGLEAGSRDELITALKNKLPGDTAASTQSSEGDSKSDSKLQSSQEQRIKELEKRVAYYRTCNETMENIVRKSNSNG